MGGFVEQSMEFVATSGRGMFLCRYEYPYAFCYLSYKSKAPLQLPHALGALRLIRFPGKGILDG
jgi:hypothetical protein